MSGIRRVYYFKTPQGISSETLLFRVREAAKALGVSRPTLRALIREGRIRTVQIGSRGIRIPLTELVRFSAGEELVRFPSAEGRGQVEEQVEEVEALEAEY